MSSPSWPWPAASGILVQPLCAATECEVDLVRKRPDHGNGLRPWIPKQRPEFHLCATESQRLNLNPLTWTSPCEDWSLTSLKEKLIKIGAKVVICGRPSMASTFLALRTIWSAAVIWPASVGGEHMSGGPDEVRRPGSLSATRAFR